MALKKEEIIGTTHLDTFGDRLRYARLNKGLTQDKLAAKHEILTQTMLSAYEKNHRGSRILMSNASILSDILDVSVEWLLTGKEKIVIPDGKLLALSNNFAPILKWEEIHPWKILGRDKMNVSKIDYVPLMGIESENCFAVKLGNPAYDAYQSVPFTLGDTIIINPDKAPDIGSYVIVSHDKGATIILRRVAENGFLVHLNAVEMEKVCDDTIFYGVVVAVYKKLAV